jgi:hypothetical protein
MSSSTLGEIAIMKPGFLRKSLEAIVTPYLLENGFESQTSGKYIFEYIRPVPGGRDVVVIKFDRTKMLVGVLISYFPDCLEFVDEIYGLTDYLARGQLVPSFLTPGAVSPNPRPWRFDSEEKLQRSLEQMRTAFEEIGFPWLEKMHSPAFYASKTDQVAAFSSAIAFEAAGDYVKARELFVLKRRAHEGILTIGNLKTAERFFTEHTGHGKEFIYVAHKLGVVDDFCKRLMEIHNYHPDFPPLPE